ncbi:hypothetical protein GGS20DRAFT_596514 [Poronia punctata]|nr:hypothetical protein GGS20DRAFT_596514 [Poronia punctata]
MAAPENPEPVSGAEDRPTPEQEIKPPPRKRRRIVISCTECHRRKQKVGSQSVLLSECHGCCDRKLPCTNCESRNKESSCRYETGAPVIKQESKTPPSSSRQKEQSPPEAKSKSRPSADFGYSTHATSTLGILRRIEGASAPLAGMPSEIPSEESNEMREHYKSLIRQLPARTYVEKLIDVYFHDVNWLYFGIDEPMTRDLMNKWYRLPFNVLSASGPMALDPSLRALPALLFQMVACALLYLPHDSQKTFECIKYTTGMTFDDLSVEYSEAGMAILTLLGKRQMSVVTVMAGWCRASLLKFTGMVTEAWHQVGTCIRDAQGIGLHRDQMDPQPTAEDSSEEAIEKMWAAQQRRKMWVILMGWDLHTGAVLGRPTSIDHRNIPRTSPVDAILPKSGKRVPLVPRTADDPPTPLTRTLWSWQIMKTLREIQDLEKEGPFPKDFSRVEQIHAEILDTKSRTPPPFRQTNPDTRFDKLPECWWLPYVRCQLPQLHAFNILALHRPYVFTRAASRHAALGASLDMLESQRQQFAALEPSQHRTYSLFFGTFDAVVMVASIFILFPKEHPELLEQAQQHFRWAVDRFELMAARNHLARSALGVLQAIWIRFKKAVGYGFLSNDCCSMTARAETEAATRWLTSQAETHRGSHDSTTTPTATTTSAHSSSSAQPTPNTEATAPLSASSNGPSPQSAPADPALVAPEWTLPTDFDFGTIVPMYPMGDIAYNDLTGALGTMPEGVRHPTSTANWVGGMSAATESPDHTGMAAGGYEMAGMLPMNMMDQNAPWQFNGEFGSDTIWNVLNQFPSS